MTSSERQRAEDSDKDNRSESPLTNLDEEVEDVEPEPSHDVHTESKFPVDDSEYAVGGDEDVQSGGTNVDV